MVISDDKQMLLYCTHSSVQFMHSSILHYRDKNGLDFYHIKLYILYIIHIFSKIYYMKYVKYIYYSIRILVLLMD